MCFGIQRRDWCELNCKGRNTERRGVEFHTALCGGKGRASAETQEWALCIHEGLTEVEPWTRKSVQIRKGHIAGAFNSRQRTVKSVGSIPEKLNGETVSFKIKAIPPFSSGQWNTEQRVWSWLSFPLPDPLYNPNISKFSSWLLNCRGLIINNIHLKIKIFCFLGG